MSMVTSRGNIWMQTAFHTLQARYLHLRAIAKTNKARRQRFRTTFSELCALSNRELADLGIPRSHIRRLALEEMAKGPTNENL